MTEFCQKFINGFCSFLEWATDNLWIIYWCPIFWFLDIEDLSKKMKENPEFSTVLVLIALVILVLYI